MSDVMVETRDGVLRVTINRPEKRNPLSRAVLADLRAAFEHHAHDATLHCAVLTGAGDKSFAAGGDLAEFDRLRSVDDARALFDNAAATLDSIHAFPVPVIAALNGTALGGGAELAMACAYRVAAPHARFGFVQATLGITTGFGGGAYLIAALGAAQAARVLASAELWSAEAARARGLIDEIAPSGPALGDTVDAFAEPFLSRPPHVVRAIRRMTLAGTREAERESFVRTWTDPAHWDAVARMLAAQQEKREQR